MVTQAQRSPVRVKVVAASIPGDRYRDGQRRNGRAAPDEREGNDLVEEGAGDDRKWRSRVDDRSTRKAIHRDMQHELARLAVDAHYADGVGSHVEDVARGVAGSACGHAARLAADDRGCVCTRAWRLVEVETLVAVLAFAVLVEVLTPATASRCGRALVGSHMAVLARLGAAGAAALLKEAAYLARCVALVLSLVVLERALVVVVTLVVLERALVVVVALVVFERALVVVVTLVVLERAPVGRALVVLEVAEAEAGVPHCQQGVRGCEHRVATGVVREVVGRHDLLDKCVDVDPRHTRRAEEAAVLSCDGCRDPESALEHVGQCRYLVELVAEGVEDVLLSQPHDVRAE